MLSTSKIINKNGEDRDWLKNFKVDKEISEEKMKNVVLKVEVR